jgi:nicotinate-nucleotide adenylyltransferase
MPTLCFGGTFNPIHNAHLLCAQAVAEKAGYDRVLLIPTGSPPHKTSDELASATDRLAMCRLAIEGRKLFAVSDIETRRGGASYTLDTVRELSQTGQKTINWLIGGDMLMYLPKWHRIGELLNEVNFVVMARPGWVVDWSALPSEFQPLQSHVVEAPLIGISASEIRRRVRAGEAIDAMVPAEVARYISAHHLYRSLN